MRDVIEGWGLFCSLHPDRGSHYWNTPEAGGKVDKGNPTQFGRAMKRLGIEMIPAYSPEARGRSERVFRTHQDRLAKELACAGITEMAAANAYLRTRCLPAYNAEFRQPAPEEGSAFVDCPDLGVLDDIPCEHHQRVVGRDNCVRFEGLTLQIPADRHRCHYVKAKVRVLRRGDGALSVRHGPRELARYDAKGNQVLEDMPAAARGQRWGVPGGLALQGLPSAKVNSGQFICYRTGHFYLLLTSAAGSSQHPCAIAV